jgi:enamine deaminase RidA (YjgF/YER057c/UK114 family)
MRQSGIERKRGDENAEGDHHDWTPSGTEDALLERGRVGNTIWVAGQGGLGKDGKVVAPGDIEAQTRQALQNLQEILTKAGATLADVVKVTTFITNRTAGMVAKYDRVFGEFFPTRCPTSTLVEVKPRPFRDAGRDQTWQWSGRRRAVPRPGPLSGGQIRPPPCRHHANGGFCQNAFARPATPLRSRHGSRSKRDAVEIPAWALADRPGQRGDLDRLAPTTVGEPPLLHSPRRPSSDRRAVPMAGCRAPDDRWVWSRGNEIWRRISSTERSSAVSRAATQAK